MTEVYEFHITDADFEEAKSDDGIAVVLRFACDLDGQEKRGNKFDDLTALLWETRNDSRVFWDREHRPPAPPGHVGLGSITEPKEVQIWQRRLAIWLWEGLNRCESSAPKIQPGEVIHPRFIGLLAYLWRMAAENEDPEFVEKLESSAQRQSLAARFQVATAPSYGGDHIDRYWLYKLRADIASTMFSRLDSPF